MKKLLVAIALLITTPAIANDCQIPENLHPVSRATLELYLTGKIGTESFVRFFSAPNSNYIDFSICIANKTDPDWEKFANLPWSVKFYILTQPSKAA